MSIEIALCLHLQGHVQHAGIDKETDEQLRWERIAK